MTRESIRLIQTGLNALGHAPKPDRWPLWQPDPRRDQAVAGRRRQGRAGLCARPPAQLPTTSAMIHQGAARYPVREIFLHCAATWPDWMARKPIAEKVAEIRRRHTSPTLRQELPEDRQTCTTKLSGC